MRIKLLTILVCLYCQTATKQAAAQTALHIDNTHSSIQFSVPFFGISEVTGSFQKFCGQLNFDTNNVKPTSLELYILSSSINTGLKIRDRDLVQKYLESARYPIIYYKSKSIRISDRNQYEVDGELELHGVKKEMHLVLSVIADIVNGESVREVGFKLQPLKIARTDFGIMEGSMGSGSVGDTVSISSVIRVRDVTPYRKDIDKKYPEKKLKPITSFSGNYTNNSGAKIELVSEGDKYFLSYGDEDWSWFAEAVMVGPKLYKLLSFSNLVELKDAGLTFTTPEGVEQFNKVDLR